MKSVRISILSWGIYLVVLGLSFVFIPLPVVALFGYHPGEDLWIRVLGILSAVLGLYYVQVAIHHIRVLYKWKLVGHAFGLCCMIFFLIKGFADERLIGTMVVELAAGLWTAFTLKKIE